MANTSRQPGLSALQEFLSEKFDDTELRMLARTFTVEHVIPGRNASVSELASELVQKLEHRGGLDSTFFEGLRKVRPRHAKQITSLAENLRTPRNRTVSSPPSKSQPAEQQPRKTSKKREIAKSLREFMKMINGEGYLEPWNETVAIWAKKWELWMSENLSPDHYAKWRQAVQEPARSIFRRSVDPIEAGYRNVETLLAGLSKVYE